MAKDRNSSQPDEHAKLIALTTERFEAAWRSGSEPHIPEYLPSLPAHLRTRLLTALVLIDLSFRWARGGRRRVEDYLADWPDLAADRERIRELIRGEFRARAAQGDQPDPADYQQRFPWLETDWLHGITGQPTGSEGPASGDGSVSDLGATAQPQVTGASQLDWPSADSPSPTRGLPDRIGRYAVRALLGGGGFGQVFLGHDEEMDRLVAIKVPSQRLTASARARESFLREARNAARLEHPNIVTVYDFGESELGWFVVYKYIDGISLQVRLRQGPLEPRQAALLAAQVADALNRAHALGVFHRDVKPGNILLDSAGNAYLTDFGIAVRDEELASELGGQAGTYPYMSPEQMRGEWHLIDGRTDIYALGVVLYEMLCRQRPFGGKGHQQRLQQVQWREPRPLRQINSAIPPELERICLKALSKRREDRYTTAGDMAWELRAAVAELGGSSLAATPAGSGPMMPSSRTGPAAQGSLQSDWPAAGSTGQQPVTTSAAGPKRLTVMPKGLRAFGPEDADFFLELLPGPRDRHGLPDSIRFWKARIESLNEQQTFRVGLLYGPSGCGKSSLVRAGLLPRLDSSIVEAIYLECPRERTEQRLARAIVQLCPDLGAGEQPARTAAPDQPGAPPARWLPRLLAAVRRRGGLPGGRKLLIVLDQLEQWLHTHPDPRDNELLLALRQCDGRHVQCLLMVRDDFWVAVTRFTHELEVHLSTPHNLALVDLFDQSHARKVLVQFGRAYGRLPDRDAEIGPEQDRFLQRAVEQLAQDGKVVPVRLALLAEMVKGRPWVEATLKELGGVEGIGVAFLEESFCARTANPEHRLFEKPARAVLKALLPESGTSIRGKVRSYQELLAASGLQRRTESFDRLLQILDSELRLLTPADPETGPAQEPPEPAASPATPPSLSVESRPPTPPERARRTTSTHRHYQLTHDYLIPSLRTWLTRKQQQTRKGRAELRLAERATLWNQKQENRHLPSLFEWCSIHLLTSKRARSSAEQAMLRQANWYYFRQAALVLIGTVLLSWLGVESYGRFKAGSLVRALLTAQTRETPELIEELGRYGRWARPLLRQAAQAAPAASPQRLHAAMALLPDDPGQLECLTRGLLRAKPSEFLFLCEFLEPYQRSLTERLWRVFEDASQSREARFRAACALAAYVPRDGRWDQAADQVTAQLLATPSVFLRDWIEALSPVRDRLLPSLQRAFSARRGMAGGRYAAAEVLAEYASDRPDLLVGLIAEADARQFAVLFDKAAAHGRETVSLLEAELVKRAEYDWHDPPLEPGWATPDTDLVRRIEAADGVLAERFALCQCLPLDSFEPLAGRLQACGYRPARFRPYRQGSAMRVAAVWTRDGRDWRLACGLSAEQVLERNETLNKEGFWPVDLASCPTDADGSGPLYAALWVRSPELAGAQLAVGLTSKQHQAKWQAMGRSGYRPVSLCTAVGANGRTRYSTVWSKLPERENRAAAVSFLGIQAEYAKRAYLDQLQTDVRVARFTVRSSAKDQASRELARLDKALADDPDNHELRRDRVRLHLALGHYEAAMTELAALDDRDYARWPQLYGYRAIGYALSGQANEARRDVATVRGLDIPDSTKAYVDAVVATLLGEDLEGMKRLEAAIAAHHDNVDFLYEAARAYCTASAFFADRDAAKSQVYADRAVGILKRAVAGGFTEFTSLQKHPAFDPIRGHREFVALMRQAHMDRFYTAVWIANRRFMSVRSYGLPPDEHLARCRRFMAQGYRPVSLSVAEISPGQPLVTASVWQRPRLGPGVRQPLASRRANAAIALVRLGYFDKARAVFEHQPDPQARSYLIHRLGPFGVELRLLLQHLVREADPSVRRTLILSLGQYDQDQLNPAQRQTCIDMLLPIYRDDPDSGVHGAVEWLLSRWGQTEALSQAKEQLATGKTIGGRHWYVTSQGQTMVVIPGPIEFLMGAPLDEVSRRPNEVLHRRRIPRTFAVASTETTVEQYRRFLQENPSFSRPANRQDQDQQDHPQANVSWYDAAAYCNWLSRKEGIPERQWCYLPNPSGTFADGMQLAPDYLSRTGYRLPTEAEWECACRAGATTSRCYGQAVELLGQYAWYVAVSQDRSYPVATLKPNDFGIFDMHGNLWELCQSYLGGPAYSQALARPLEDRAENQLVVHDNSLVGSRGGSFVDQPAGIRCAARLSRHPGESAYNWGFRVARTMPPRRSGR